MHLFLLTYLFFRHSETVLGGWKGHFLFNSSLAYTPSNLRFCRTLNYISPSTGYSCSFRLIRVQCGIKVTFSYLARRKFFMQRYTQQFTHMSNLFSLLYKSRLFRPLCQISRFGVLGKSHKLYVLVNLLNFVLVL